MRYVKFKMVTGELTDSIGVLPSIHKNWPNYNPSLPSGLGHDLLEHGTKETGAFDEECAALGGFMFVRDFGSYSSGFRPYPQVIADDIVSSLQDCSRFGDVRPSPQYKLDTYDDERITEIMAKARNFAVKGWVSEYSDNHYESESDAPANPFEDDQIWSNIVGWVKSGYARANRRFNSEQGTAYALYQSVEREFKKYWSSLEQVADSGLEFSLALDYENGCATIQYSHWL